MKVQNVNTVSCGISFHAKNTKQLPLPSTPIHDGISTASVWFGFGVALDFVSRRCHFFKSTLKNSIVMNGLIALGAGVFTYVKDMFTDSKNNS